MLVPSGTEEGAIKHHSAHVGYVMHVVATKHLLYPCDSGRTPKADSYYVDMAGIRADETKDHTHGVHMLCFESSAS